MCSSELTRQLHCRRRRCCSQSTLSRSEFFFVVMAQNENKAILYVVSYKIGFVLVRIQFFSQKINKLNKAVFSWKAEVLDSVLGEFISVQTVRIFFMLYRKQCYFVPRTKNLIFVLEVFFFCRKSSIARIRSQFIWIIAANLHWIFVTHAW